MIHARRQSVITRKQFDYTPFAIKQNYFVGKTTTSNYTSNQVSDN
jgi:hypothetical protein